MSNQSTIIKKIAIISPNQDAYSETFIKAHKDFLSGEIHFLYGGYMPRYAENLGALSQIKSFSAKFSNFSSKMRGQKGESRETSGLKRYLSKNKIDIVLAEYGPTGATILPVVMELSIPLIVFFHGYDASMYQVLDEYKDLYKCMFQYSTNIIVVSEVMKQEIIHLGCDESKVNIIKYGSNKIFQTAKPKFSKKQFIAVGRYVDKKAPYYLILSFVEVIKSHPDARLIIAGDGILLNSTKNLVNAFNLENNIVFPGIITPEEFKNYLSESIAFVQHSITAENGDMEGSPVSIFEACASGIPVISTKHAGIPEVITHMENGLLVEEHDFKGMANCMIYLLDNIDIAKKMGINAKKTGEAFSMDTYISKLQDLIDSI